MITLEIAEAKLTAALAAVDSASGVEEVEISTDAGRRRVKYSSAELAKQVTYWQRIVNDLKRQAARQRTHSVARFY